MSIVKILTLDLTKYKVESFSFIFAIFSVVFMFYKYIELKDEYIKKINNKKEYQNIFVFNNDSESELNILTDTLSKLKNKILIKSFSSKNNKIEIAFETDFVNFFEFIKKFEEKIIIDQIEISPIKNSKQLIKISFSLNTKIKNIQAYEDNLNINPFLVEIDLDKESKNCINLTWSYKLEGTSDNNSCVISTIENGIYEKLAYKKGDSFSDKNLTIKEITNSSVKLNSNNKCYLIEYRKY